MNKNHIALLDEKDNIIGYEEKLKVHQKGLLHRAFSILVFNDDGEILLQKRASTKYHSPGLWTNTCCSHLIKSLDFDEYIHSRLLDEMGFDCELKYKCKFHYLAEFENGLTENEIDHVYIGHWNGTPSLNSEEADDYQWESIENIKKGIKENPDEYTYWFKEIMKREI